MDVMIALETEPQAETARLVHVTPLTRFISWFVVATSALTLVACVMIEHFDLDRRFSAQYYDASLGWRWVDQEPFSTIDHVSAWAGTALGITSLIVGIVCWFRWRWSGLHRACVVMVLLVLAGPVLVINALMKPQFDRPRPREITEFNGPHAYVAAWVKGTSPDRNSSFPSGHASIGFYLIGLAFAFGRTEKSFLMIFATTAAYGALVAFSRIIQGGHFLNDVLSSFLVMLLLAWTISSLTLVLWPRAR